MLKVNQESETVVQPGAPLVEIGDPLDLEVIADVLSTDAVQINTGASVRIDGWGGQPIEGRVTRIDPAGFTTAVQIGHRNARLAEVLAGLSKGDQIVLHPSDGIADGVRISQRAGN